MARPLPAARAPDRAPADPPATIAALTATGTWRLAAGVLGQTALLTAVLLFFGWARTQATFAYFGVDLSLLNLSTTDYVLRSVGSAYTPLLLLGLGYLAAAMLHALLARSSRPRRHVRRGLLGVGWALVAIGVSALLWGAEARTIGSWVPDDPGIAFAWLPATLTAGFALLLYAALAYPPGGGDRALHATLAFAALVVLGLFWTVSLLAVHDGLAHARQIERDPGALPEVSLLARQPLVIEGPGVIATPLGVPGARYKRSYSGLRLLAHVPGKYLLIPLAWRHGRDRVYVVPDDGDVRIELIAH